MRDGDDDGVVCESGSRRGTSPPASPRASGPHVHADAAACAACSGAVHRVGRRPVRGYGHRRPCRLRNGGLVQEVAGSPRETRVTVQGARHRTRGRRLPPCAWQGAPPLTLVPVPPSRARDDPLYDDRMTRMLQAIWTGQQADIRELIVQTESTPRRARGQRRRPSGPVRDPESIRGRRGPDCARADFHRDRRRRADNRGSLPRRASRSGKAVSGSDHRWTLHSAAGAGCGLTRALSSLHLGKLVQLQRVDLPPHPGATWEQPTFFGGDRRCRPSAR